ncbi:MAG: EAL domain-containing protein [Qipengyuania sp.]|jgi:diguanylate cyclase (GGDEF)-like protein|nr:EAL domain-containing protein [Qipengyuania sp.]
MVLGPAAILSAIFVLTLTAGYYVAGRTGSAPHAIVLGGASFAAAVILLVRSGLRQVSRLERLGVTDALTGLPNRHALHHDFKRLARGEEEMAIALIDLDGFMLVNEHYGHSIGDRAIRESGAIFLTICGEEASVYRLGGDEFALLKSGPLAATLLEGLCRKIVERMMRPVKVDERRLTLGASVGLARRSAGEDVSSSELLRRGDVAMYSSKRGGKARCTWYSPEFDRSREVARELDDELRQGIVNDEFCLHYQPLVDCNTREIVAVEALIRWERPDGKKIGPNVFIPVAEESGLINPLGLWVLRRACRDATAWAEIKLSVNLSAAQLRNPEFPIQLGHILEETGFDPERLELEITETCLVLDPVVAERSLAVIRGFGVNVVLDDFGTGYASFGFLRQFRFEKLKLDRSLVVEAGEDDGSRAVMLSSITVARAMNMGVTAEGVETEEQAEMVRAAGCDQIQGWLYFKAMPASEIAQHLARKTIPAAGRPDLPADSELPGSKVA